MTGEGNVILLIVAVILVVILLCSDTALASLMVLAGFLSFVVGPVILVVAGLLYLMGPKK